MPQFKEAGVAHETQPAVDAPRTHSSRRKIPPPLSKKETDWFQEEGGKPKNLRETPESERVETSEQTMRLQKPQMMDEAKVIVSPEAAKTREQHAREKQEREREEKVAEIKSQLHGNGIEKIARRSENERSLVRDIVQEMRTHIDRGDATEATLGHYRHELLDLQSAIEQLQAQARESGHGAKGISATHELNEVVSANFEALTKISTALHASKLERTAAQKELAPYTQAIDIPEDEKSAKVIEESIEAKYGADPESLRAGGGSFLKRNLFNFKHWLAQKTNQPSEYDIYRNAKTREYSKKNESPAPTNIPEPEVEDHIPKGEEQIPKPLEAFTKDMETSEHLTKEISIEDARTLVPRAYQLWEFMNRRMTEKSTALLNLDSIAKKYNIMTGQAPATIFVLLVGKYLDLRENVKDKDSATTVLQDINKISAELGVQGSALLQRSLGESGSQIKDTTSGARRRNTTTSARQVRSKF